MAGDRLLRVEELPVSASGTIAPNGQARFQVASMVNADGQMLEKSGSGKLGRAEQVLLRPLARRAF